MAKSQEKELFDKAVSKKMNNYKPGKFTIFILVITILISLFYFIYSLFINNSNYHIINSLLLLIFNIIYIILIFKAFIKKKGLIVLSSLLLIIIYAFNIVSSFDVVEVNEVNDSLYGKDINTLINYSRDNNLKLTYDYEYSDMIDKNHIISYKLDKKDMKVVMSLGSNPSKLINLPNMISWEDEEVLKYLEDNQISNVDIKYVSSDKIENTLVKQSKKGEFRRDDKLELEFSYGNELSFTDCKLRDLNEMSLVHVVMYLEKNHLKYEIIKEYSDKKINTVFKQSIEPGTTLKINNKTIKIYISKGKKIKMIDVTNKDIYDVNKWLLENDLIIKYEEKYDSKISKNHIIKANKNKDDILTTNEVVTIYLSKGNLMMKKFNKIEDFRKWALKNEIEYVEEYEFNNDYKVGEIISTSIKANEPINSDDVITVVISEGKKNEMMDLIGMDKDKAIAKLKEKKISYNITYEKGDKDKVLNQSIRPGSEISENTTVSLIIGK